MKILKERSELVQSCSPSQGKDVKLLKDKTPNSDNLPLTKNMLHCYFHHQRDFTAPCPIKSLCIKFCYCYPNLFKVTGRMNYLLMYFSIANCFVTAEPARPVLYHRQDPAKDLYKYNIDGEKIVGEQRDTITDSEFVTTSKNGLVSLFLMAYQIS